MGPPVRRIAGDVLVPDDVTDALGVEHDRGDVAIAVGNDRQFASLMTALGLDDELGSLTVGKIADVVLTEGDLFEATTPVTGVMIDGEFVGVGNRQTDLYDYYRDRMLELKAK